MRRSSLLLGLVLAIAVVAPPAGSAPIKPRTVEFEYTGVSEIRLLPFAQIQGFACLEHQGTYYGSACFLTGSRDRFIDVDVTDESGLPIAFAVYQGDTSADYCESTGKPVPVRSHAQVEILLGVVGCAVPSMPVKGIIRVTFSR